jgi:hypothetical protein
MKMKKKLSERTRPSIENEKIDR